MALDPTTGTRSRQPTTTERKRARAILRRREAERRRDATRSRDEQRRSEALDKSVTPTRARPPVAGESAKDKVPVADPAAGRLRAVQAERNRKVGARPKPNVSTETGLMLNPAAALTGLLAFGDPNIKRGFRDTRRFAKGALETIRDPRASKKEKLEAALGTTAIAGGIGSAPSSGPKPRRTRPMPGGATTPARSLRLNEKTQQLPAARSRVTRRLLERPADRVSRAAMGEGKVASAVRATPILKNIAADARVSKAAGREQVLEASRANAAMARHTRALPKEGTPEDVAHSWWAQLPASHRNAEGLKLVRGKQAEELEEITSGRALEALKRRQGAIQAQLRDADEATRFDLMKQAEDVKLLISDLPRRVEDVSASLARLDRVIAKPPKLRPDVIEAVNALSRDRRSILEAAEVLKPERAGEREGLVSRWVGLEPTGEEAFLGHRLGKVRSSQPSLTPVSVGAGRVRLPQGVARENKLVLAKTGRLRESTRVAAEDWQAAQVYRASTTARKDLAQMGKPFEGRLPEGYLLVNPKGRAVPPHWKTDKLAKIGQEGFDEDEIAKASKEIVSTFVADADNRDAMLAAARDAGVKWEELRVVPEKLARRYFGQFTPPGGTTKGGKVYDAAIDFTAASIIFARLGYIPKNIAQNLIVSVPHQGPKLLLNAPRAGQVLADKELRPLVQAEVGFTGATQGLASEARFLRAAGKKARNVPSTVAGAVGKVGDDPLRISAFIHEAAAAGVISKWKPVLDEADKANLIALLTDKQYRPLLNDIRSRSVEAMADFSRLTPTQRRWARRFLIIPGWLWAGSRYPVHFAATHPGRSAAIAGGAYLGQDEIRERTPDDLPHYIEGIETGNGKVLRTTSLSPISTPWEIAGALAQQSPRTAADYGNPLAKGLYNVASRTVDGPSGPYRTNFATALQRNVERVVPNVDFARDMIRPDTESRYPEDATRLGRLKRELGVFPIEIEREKTPAARAASGVFEDRAAFHAAAQKVMPDALEDGRLPKKLRTAFNIEAERQAMYARASAGKEEATAEYHLARYEADLRLLVKHSLVTKARAAEVLRNARNASLDDLKKARSRISERYYQGEGGQLYVINHARKALRERGVEVP